MSITPIDTRLPDATRIRDLLPEDAQFRVEAVRTEMANKSAEMVQAAAIRALAGDQVGFTAAGIYGMGAATAPKGIMNRVIEFFDVVGSHDANHFAAAAQANTAVRGARTK